jgi:uncharacterized protein
MDILLGIDYGAKLAGTTALAWMDKSGITIVQSEKKLDADVFILQVVSEIKPTIIFLDAPLSLPPAFTNPSSTEYFYRKGDKELYAMSPMFIGGLTARAMKLKRKLEEDNIHVFETYPAGLNKKVIQSEYYKKDLAQFEKVIRESLKVFDAKIETIATTWHQMDALLALVSALRWQQGEHLTFGDEGEGQIII